MKVLVKVTKEILVKTANCAMLWNKVEDSTGMNCAITHAVREIFPFCCTGYLSITICKTFKELLKIEGNNHISIELPTIAINFIRDFDKASPEERINMEPISFEIDISNELIERIGIGQIYKILSESKTLEHIN